jgi:nitrogen-specific signal transduction histidine kinase
MTNRPSNLSLPDVDLARKVIEHSVDGLLVIDAEGVVRFANLAAMSLFAGRTSQLVGFNVGAPAVHEAVELIFPGGKSARYVEMRSTEIEWEGRIANLASLRDITEHKLAGSALQKQAAELQLQTAELHKRNSELIRFNRAAVGRELRMIELKREVNELSVRLGEGVRHRIPGEDSTGIA